MNLGLEYLQRTKLIQELVRIPCSLYLDNSHQQRLIITLDKSRRGVMVRSWHLENFMPSLELPQMTKKVVQPQQLFDEGQVIPSGFRPLYYQEDPYEPGLNHHRRPMDDLLYKFYLRNFLNSGPHTQYKENSLWDWFFSLHTFGVCYDLEEWADDDEDTSEYTIQTMRRMQQFDQRNTPLWAKWLKWRKQLFPDRNALVAGELAFAKFW